MKSRIKKAAVGALTVVMVLSIGGISAFATENEYGRNFVDVDGDGICDNRDVERVSCKEYGRDFVDADEDGICDNCNVERVSHKECGRNFEDVNGNDVCDKYDQRHETRHGIRHGRGFDGRHKR